MWRESLPGRRARDTEIDEARRGRDGRRRSDQRPTPPGRCLAVSVYVEFIYETASGFEEILRKYDAEWVNLIKVKRIKKRIDGYYFKEIEVPAVFEGAYFITLPKLKTNIVTGITASLKNQYGCLCVLKKNVYHDVVDEVIVDINLAIKPHLCIVDGIVGMGGVQGPAFGIPIPAGVLIGGKDPVAVDALCARIIGFNPRSIKHIKLVAKAGLGSLKYRVVGDPMPRVNF